MMQLKTYLKFILNYIIELITENPFKSIFLILAVISFHFAGSFASYDKATKIEKEIKVDTGYVYLYQKISDSEIKYDIIYSREKLNIDKNGYLHTIEYHGANILFWLIFGISMLIVIIASFDSDSGWDFGDVRDRAFGSIVQSEIEEGEYIYFCMGRLVGKSNRQVRRKYIPGEFGVRGLRDLYTCPKYKTKSQNRENLLNKLGIS